MAAERRKPPIFDPTATPFSAERLVSSSAILPMAAIPVSLLAALPEISGDLAAPHSAPPVRGSVSELEGAGPVGVASPRHGEHGSPHTALLGARTAGVGRSGSSEGAANVIADSRPTPSALASVPGSAAGSADQVSISHGAPSIGPWDASSIKGPVPDGAASGTRPDDRRPDLVPDDPPPSVQSTPSTARPQEPQATVAGRASDLRADARGSQGVFRGVGALDLLGRSTSDSMLGLPASTQPTLWDGSSGLLRPNLGSEVTSAGFTSPSGNLQGISLGTGWGRGAGGGQAFDPGRAEPFGRLAPGLAGSPSVAPSFATSSIAEPAGPRAPAWDSPTSKSPAIAEPRTGDSTPGRDGSSGGELLAASASFAARPAGGGAGGLIARAWRFRQGVPFALPVGGDDSAAMAAFRTLDALIVQYVDRALEALPSGTSSWYSDTIMGSDAIGSFTFTYGYSYNHIEVDYGSFYTLDEDNTFNYWFTHAGTAPGGITTSADAWGEVTARTTADAPHDLTGSLSGMGEFSAVQNRDLSIVSGGATLIEDATVTHAGDNLFTYIEGRTETYSGSMLTGGSLGYTWDEHGDDTVGLNSTRVEVASDAATGGTTSVTTNLNAAGILMDRSLHTAGDDTFGTGGYFTSGSRQFTYDVEGGGGPTWEVAGGAQLPSLPGSGSESLSFTGGGEVQSLESSLHHRGGRTYTASGSDNFTWDEHGTSSITLRETVTEAASDLPSTTMLGVAGFSWGTRNAYTATTSTLVEVSTVTDTLHESGSHTLYDGAVLLGGTVGFTWAQTASYGRTLNLAHDLALIDLGTETFGVGNLTGSASHSLSLASAETAVFSAGTTVTAREAGSRALGFGGVMLGGSADSTLSVTATHSADVTRTVTNDDAHTLSWDDWSGGRTLIHTESGGAGGTMTLTDHSSGTGSSRSTAGLTLGASGIVTGGTGTSTLHSETSNTLTTAGNSAATRTPNTTQTDNKDGATASENFQGPLTDGLVFGGVVRRSETLHQESGATFAAGYVSGGSGTATLDSSGTDTLSSTQTHSSTRTHRLSDTASAGNLWVSSSLVDVETVGYTAPSHVRRTDALHHDASWAAGLGGLLASGSAT